MATSGKAWREARENGVEIKFPSGFTASIRPIDVDFFVRVGRVPNVMAGMLADLLDGKHVKMDKPPLEKLEDRRDWLDFLNELVKYAFISPRIVDDPQADDEISIDDLAYGDKFIVYQLFAQPAEVLRRFRDAQSKFVAVVDDPKNNGAAAQQSARHSQVVEPVAGDA